VTAGRDSARAAPGSASELAPRTALRSSLRCPLAGSSNPRAVLETTMVEVVRRASWRRASWLRSGHPLASKDMLLRKLRSTLIIRFYPGLWNTGAHAMLTHNCAFPEIFRLDARMSERFEAGTISETAQRQA
jgi:hypothetical protein